MDEAHKEALLEAIKEPLRYGLLGIYAWLLTDGVIFNILALFRVWLPDAVRVILAALILSFLRGLDKYMHKISQEEPIDEMNVGLLGEHGLTGF
jgi:hypothetical protein